MPINLLNPFLFWGATIAAAPLIIHLLHRRRFKVVQWAAMKFLLASQKKNNRRVKFEHLLLLIIRTLLILAVVVAICRPILSSNQFAALTGVQSDRHVFLMMDTSYSMTQQVGPNTAFELAIDGANKLIDSLSESDKVSIISVADRPAWVIREPSYNMDSVRAELIRLECSHQTTEIISGLNEIAERLEGSVSDARREVYVFTDFQNAGWNIQQLRSNPDHIKRLKELSNDTVIYLVDVGGATPSNLAVSQINILQDTVLLGDLTTFEATVANYSGDNVAKVVVDFHVDSLKQATKSVSISSGRTAAVRFDHVFSDELPHAVRVAIRPDRLPLDDSRYLSVKAAEAVRVLCIDGAMRSGQQPGTSRFIAAALNPTTDRDAGLPIRTTFVSPFQVKESLFTDFDVVIMANVGILADDAAASLERFVTSGGGLVIFGGDLVEPEFYNRHLYRNGDGVLPAKILSVVESPPQDERGFFLQPESYKHRIMTMFEGLGGFPLSSPIVSKYLKTGDDDHASLVICPWNTADAAILEKRSGLGSCILFTTSADVSWTSLPKKPVFLPLLYESLLHLVRNVDPASNLNVGQAYRKVLQPREVASKFVFTRLGPDLTRTETAKPRTMSGTPEGTGFVVTYDDTERAGVYSVEKRAADSELKLVGYLSVNAPTEESNLSRITSELISQAIPGFVFKYIKEVGQLASATEKSDGPSGLWKQFLWFALFLICAESVLAHRFGK